MDMALDEIPGMRDEEGAADVEVQKAEDDGDAVAPDRSRRSRAEEPEDGNGVQLEDGGPT